MHVIANVSLNELFTTNFKTYRRKCIENSKNELLTKILSVMIKYLVLEYIYLLKI